MRCPKVLTINIANYQNTVYEWAGEGPTVLFCHATGFHGRIWDQVISKLPYFHCIAIDLRGHGLSSKPPPPYPWDSFVPDIKCIIETLGLTNIIGVGHSMGGHIITSLATNIEENIKGLVLCDPSLFQEERYKSIQSYKNNPEDHPVSKRRNEWSEPMEMYERLKKHPNFVGWEDEVLKDYCKYGLTINPDTGKFNLSCPPIIEASMYDSYINPSVLDRISKYEKPVHVLLAKEKPFTNEVHKIKSADFGPSITRPDIINLFPNCYGQRYSENSHFISMENTQLVADAISNMVETI
jgi:pimeloyl-ACP methyl ester carboxylesterase